MFYECTVSFLFLGGNFMLCGYYAFFYIYLFENVLIWVMSAGFCRCSSGILKLLFFKKNINTDKTTTLW
jgi:hypothetical protein